MIAPIPQPVRQWTVLSLLEWTGTHLAERGFDEARLTVELLLAHVLRLRRLDLYLQFDRPLRQEELASFRALYERRLNHEPLQYIVGEVEFYGLTLAVNPAALIPRPETEELVEIALTTMRNAGLTKPMILDVGSGTGNIAIALASRLPEASVVSIDTADEALALARSNAARNHTPVEFVRGDLFDDSFTQTGFDLIISNPPYISCEVFETLQPEVRTFEPRRALCDEADGLRFYRRLAEFAPPRLTPKGHLIVEVGAGQAPEVESLFGAAGFRQTDRLKDYAGIERVVVASTNALMEGSGK